MAVRVCRWSDLLDPGSLGFEREWNGQRLSCVVVRRGAQVWAYGNRCPHTGAPLDWRPGQVLNPEGTHIQCALHLAQFQMDDGLCVHGPCLGQSLQAVPIERRGAWVVLASSEEAEEMSGANG